MHFVGVNLILTLQMHGPRYKMEYVAFGFEQVRTYVTALYWAMKVRHFSKVFAGNSVLQQYGTFTL
jgi:hypothetical protein